MTAPTIGQRDLQVAMTLATLTTIDEMGSSEEIGATISRYLEYPLLPTANSWTIAWGPAVADSNMWYIAVGPGAAGERRYTLVIRGTNVKSLTSLLEDFEVGLTELPFHDPTAPNDVRVADGFAKAYRNLIGAVAPSTQSTAFQFLDDHLAEGQCLDVVGHSLGGAIAPIVGAAVSNRYGSAEVRVLAFAGQSPGNRAFAEYFAGLFPNQPSCWINDIDIIPMWYAGLDRMVEMYGPDGPVCPSEIRTAWKVIKPVFPDFCALLAPHRYSGERSSQASWFGELATQHNCYYYLSMTGVPTAVINACIDPTWVPPSGVSN